MLAQKANVGRKKWLGTVTTLGTSIGNSFSGHGDGRKSPIGLGIGSSDYLGAEGRSRSASSPPTALNPPPLRRLGSSPGATQTLFGVRIPQSALQPGQGKVFGRPLVEAVADTRLATHPVASSSNAKCASPGDVRARERMESKCYLTGLCFRCLEYIESYAEQEEGLYR